MKCLLDLDGVLADFHSHWYRVNPEYTRPDPWPENVFMIDAIHKITFEETCKRIDHDFWVGIDWMPDGREILTLLESKFGPENICICTSNSGVLDAASAAAGKIAWITKHLPGYTQRYLLGAAKEFLAHDNAILIDDRNENIDRFWEAGGEAFLVPRPWNRKYYVADQTVPYLKNFLAEL